MTTKIIRIKLGPSRPAPADDPLARAEIGYREDLSADELWERGRGCWVLKAERALEADLLVLAYEGRIVLVGRVDGLMKAGDGGRLAVVGSPLPEHVLASLGADPWHNKSQNPVTYGTWTTSPRSSDR